VVSPVDQQQQRQIAKELDKACRERGDGLEARAAHHRQHNAARYGDQHGQCGQQNGDERAFEQEPAALPDD
jgi:hypothetical protein